MGRFYVTTAIFYPNAVPHLGTAYEMIGADTVARWRRLRGDDVFFLSGNDEHALKVAQAAEAGGLEPLAYCDELAASFEKAWASLEVTYDEYIRTTQPRHHDTVTWFFERIRAEDEKRVARGEDAVLYKGSYEGLYCVGCEAYLREKDLVEGKCPHHPDREPQHLQEDNWFFRLTAYEERLKEWYRDNPDWLRPEPKRNEMIGLLGEGLIDLSVSRPDKATKWGIPFPGDDGHVIYVWFEALVNYVTGARLAEDGSERPDDGDRSPGFWPADLHVIGKDILRFHTIIWPAMLWAADLPLPKAVSTHGFVQVGGAKMSKSSGGTVSPIDIAEEYGPEVLRYFLLREVPWGGDGEFSIERLEERYQADLANTVGNLLHRTLTMIEKYCGGEVPEGGANDGPIAEHREGARERLADALALYDRQLFSQALDRIVDVAREANALIDVVQPWKRMKEDDGKPVVDALMHALAHSLRDIAPFLSPVLPTKARGIWTSLGLDEASFDDLVLGQEAEGHKDVENLEELHPEKAFAALDSATLEGVAVRKGDPLFPRRDR